MSGWLPDAGVSLSVMGICVLINAWAYMLPMGLAAGEGSGFRADYYADHILTETALYMHNLMA